MQNLLWGIARPDSYWTHAVYPVQKACCSPMSVTFNINEADKMHTVNYLLYHLYIFTSESRFGNKSAAVLIPEENVRSLIIYNQYSSLIYFYIKMFLRSLSI